MKIPETNFVPRGWESLFTTKNRNLWKKSEGEPSTSHSGSSRDTCGQKPLPERTHTVEPVKPVKAEPDYTAKSKKLSQSQIAFR